MEEGKLNDRKMVPSRVQVYNISFIQDSRTVPLQALTLQLLGWACRKNYSYLIYQHTLYICLE